MSAAAVRIPLHEAALIAARFLALIEPYTDRVTVAGSIRRRAATVGDIEVVAIPKVISVPTLDLFGEVVETGHVDLLGTHLTTLLNSGVITKRLRSDGHTFWGPKAKYLTYEGVSVDLFTPSADRWGIVLAIRTGPWQFSKQLVSEKGKQTLMGYTATGAPIKRVGLLPAIYRVQDGWLCYRTSGQRIPTPEEEDVFRLLGIQYDRPEDRR